MNSKSFSFLLQAEREELKAFVCSHCGDEHFENNDDLCPDCRARLKEEAKEVNGAVCACCTVEVVIPSYIVGSVGPHDWDYFKNTDLCDRCWLDSVRGDGHCYSGSFSSEQEACDHAGFLSGGE